MKSLVAHPTGMSWQIVKIDGHSFIYTETGTLICMVPKQDGASADFIVRACRHHDELVRLVRSAVKILSDGSEQNVALGFGISPRLVEEFFRQTGQVLHAIGTQPS
jgi:hypothetical protein